MATPLYLRRNRQQERDTRILLINYGTGPEHVLRAKTRVLAFLKKHPYLHLESRLIFIEKLTEGVAYNKFWKEVLTSVFDCPKERGRFRRSLLLVVRRLGKERGDKARKVISRSLAFPKPHQNRIRPVINMWTPEKRYKDVHNPTTESSILASFGIGIPPLAA